MMMDPVKLNDAALGEGLCFFHPQSNQPILVDFVVQGEGEQAGRTLVYFAGWWRSTRGQADSVAVVESPVDASPGEPGSFVFERSEGSVLSRPPTGAEATRLAEERQRVDLYRPDYLRALARVEESEQGFDFGPWKDAITSREELDPVEELRKRLSDRAVAILVQRDSSGVAVDAMAFDERGDAAVFIEDGWFASFAESWMDFDEDERPAVEDYLGWLQQQGVYGPYSLSNARVTIESGDLATHVAAVFESNPIPAVSDTAI